MAKRLSKIGVITSGGDCSGMNAALRSVVRCAIYNDIEVMGFYNAYAGLVRNEKIKMTRRSVSNIVGRGGTILKTERFEEFREAKWQKKAAAVIKKNKLDALLVIGGNGSFTAAHILSKKWGIKTIGIPATIDNDVNGSDFAVGTFTAVNVALEAIDKIRDTATSMERIFVVEVMGRKAGYIAALVGLAGGAEDILLPEKKVDLEKMSQDIKNGRKIGKKSWIIVVAEGAGKGHKIAEDITTRTGFETRVVVLGHVQRGGVPSAFDRELASRFGAKAIDLLLEGKTDKATVVKGDKITSVSFQTAIKPVKREYAELYSLTRILAT
jgi:6-phosphofructokinase 1